MLKCLSASEMFDHITGESQWDANFADDGSDAIQLKDPELFDLMFESGSDSEEASEASDSTEESPRPVARPFHLPTPACSENECSICYCEFDTLVATLDCGHRFCVACVASYLRVQISGAPRLHHKVSVVSRDGIAVVVDLIEIIGVKCPHFSCRKIIDDKKIKKLVDEITWDKFDRFALDETLTELQVNGELHPCPLKCGYFTQEDCLCVNPDCRKKQLRLRLLDEKRRAREEANDKLYKDWAVKNPELVKLCPTCYVQIEKNGGCDHMYCSRCKQSFLWSKALPFKSSHNPMYQKKHDKVMSTINI
jgi:ariadne-1